MYWILGTVIFSLSVLIILLIKVNRSLNNKLSSSTDDFRNQLRRATSANELLRYEHDVIMQRLRQQGHTINLGGRPSDFNETDEKILIKKIHHLFFENKLQKELRPDFQKILNKIRGVRGI